ncbi:MAG: 30S ribosomal protein S20 [Bdellovibrionales bacterium]|nr:30S ribosomal protein S20 [Bdellovibrionales bacterium]
MANHKSAEKRHRQNLKKRERNKLVRATVRTAIKKAKTAVENKESNAADLVRAAESLLAKAASKGIVKKANASRRISRIAKSS